MKQIKITSKDGVTLHTANKYVDDDLSITIDNADKIIPENIVKDVTILGVTGTFEGGSSEEYPNEAIKYYKENRNKNYPYFPLPSEMEETQDTIYMLYDARFYMCCPVFNITFTECVCTIQKYMNTTLVSEYMESVTSGTTKYLQFSEEDEDYSTYNYIVIKLQGNITKHYLNVMCKFNGQLYDYGDLIEVSGKCVGCDIKVVNGTYKYHTKLEYYSFLGVTSTSMSSFFFNCYSLKTTPELDTSLVNNMYYMFNECSSLQAIPLLDTHLVTSMKNMFYGCRTLKTIPLLDTSLVTDMEGMFNICSSLQAIPLLDTSNVTSMKDMLASCGSLKELPQLDTSSVTNINRMIAGCYSLKTIPLLDTHLVTDMGSMFQYCYSLLSIPLLETSNVTNMTCTFQHCNSLKTIPLLDMSNVTKTDYMFGGCHTLCKLDIINMSVSFSLKDSNKMLTQSELVKILNNLATVETTQTLTLGSTNLNKLTEEDIAIAQNKGWSVA